MKHGASAYRSAAACRCDVCKRDHRIRHRREAASRAARIAADPCLAPHGSEHTYKNWGCRCGPCTEANSAHSREQRAKRRQR